jgi:hypothetical protein
LRGRSPDRGRSIPTGDTPVLMKKTGFEEAGFEQDAGK